MPDNQLIEASKGGYSRDKFQTLLNDLLGQGVDINSTDKVGNTALIWAAFHGHAWIVEGLIKAGANVEHANEAGDTALMWAAVSGHTGIVEQLIAAGANVNQLYKYKDTSLIMAAKRGHAEIVRVIIAAGAKINHVNDYGMIALVTATRYGHEEDVIKAILGDGLFNHSSSDQEFQQSLNRINQITAALNDNNYKSDRKIIRNDIIKFLKKSIDQVVLTEHGQQVLKNLTLLKDKLSIIQPNEGEKKSGKQKTAMKALLAMIENVEHKISFDQEKDPKGLIEAVNRILASNNLNDQAINESIDTLLNTEMLPNGKAQSELLNCIKNLEPTDFELLKTKLKDIALATGGVGVRQGVQRELAAIFSEKNSSYDQNPYLFILRTGQSKFEQKDTTSFNALKSQFKRSKPGLFSRGFKPGPGTGGNKNEPLPAPRNKFGKEDL